MNRKSLIAAVFFIAAAFFFALPHESHAAISLVESQIATSTNATTALSKSFTTTPASGNLVVVAVASPANKLVSVSDNQGNKYAIAASNVVFTSVSEIHTHLYYAKNVSGSGTFTVTANLTGGANEVTLAIMNYSGVDTSYPLDRINIHSGSASPYSTGNVS